MPARLKSFELNGYKTFASRTEFQFADGITAIIGPNGSGKSNIADALRWVLGEQSYGLLRGKKTEDMIFAGSEQRSRAGMAQATVVFNNSDGWLPIDFSEVAITRRAYRDGENEYLLNGQRVRLKDVSELLAKSGLAERTYTIIGQGLVDAALALKAEDRRRLFEEAAGIGLYRGRREEALRRLDSTRRNLERVQDILTELQPRMRSLERQAKRAIEYEQIRADLNIALKEYYGYHWHLSQREFDEAHTAARKQEELLRVAQQAQVQVDEELSILRQNLQKLHLELGEGRKQLSELYQRREAISRRMVVEQERIRALLQQKEEYEAELIRRQEILTLIEERKQYAQSEVEQLSSEKRDCSEQLIEAENLFEKYRREITAAETELSRARNAVSEISGQRAHLIARLDERCSFRERQQVDFEATQIKIDKAQNELAVIQTQVDETESALGTADEKITVLENKYQEIEEKYGAIDRDIKRIQSEKSVLEGQLARRNTELEILTQAENDLSGYADGSQLLLRSLGEEPDSGLIGALGPGLLVPKVYELAISAALGEYIDGVVFANSHNVDKSLDLLKEKDAKGVIFPVDVIKPPRLIKIEPDKLPGEKNTILGIAANLVQYPDALRKVVELLLGQVLIVKDREIAKGLLDSGNWQSLPGLRVVTLAGELFSANGMITISSSAAGILSRPRRIIEIKEDLSNIEQRLAESENQLHSAEELYRSVEVIRRASLVELEDARQSANVLKDKLRSTKLAEESHRYTVSWHHDQQRRLDNEIKLDYQNEHLLESEINENKALADQALETLRLCTEKFNQVNDENVKDHLSYCKTRMAVAEQALNDTRQRYQERAGDVDRAEKDIVGIRERIGNITDELSKINQSQEETHKQEQEINQAIAGLKLIVEPVEVEANHLEEEQNHILDKDTAARQRFRTAEHYHTQAKINLARKQEVLDSLRRRIEDDFGLVSLDYVDSVSGPKPLPIIGMVEELSPVAELSPEVEQSIHRLRAQLKRVGPINIEAQNEYIEVSERFRFMTDQVADLNQAEKDIQEVITELDVIMEREFRRTFEAVAQEFKLIFTRLFNGGIARLVLTDTDNLSETGIDIEARLPGRREQGLSLLSGGERSLTAVALVFALLRISPTPFCILDEVDAMLDEANVSRFREMLTELSGNTQFIVITHNRNTVQAAGVIYGVTMGRDTASQVISMKLGDVNGEYGV